MPPTTQVRYDRLVEETDSILDKPGKDDAIYTSVSGATITSRIPGWFKTELKQQLKLAWPLVLVVGFTNIAPTMSLAFTGHLDTTSLAGQSLAISLINVLAIGVGIGLSSACDTMFAQTFGTEQKKEIGNQLQRCLIMMTLYCFPIWSLFMNAESLLLLTGQEPAVAKIAADYLLWFFPGVWFNFMYNVLCRYLMNQNIVRPLVVVGFLANVVNAGFHYLFVFTLDFGSRGSAIALSSTYAGLAIFTSLYIIIFRIHKPTWDGWSLSAFKNWGTFNRLAIPGMCMVLLEWSALEISTIMAGTLGEVEVATQIIIMQLAVITYSMYFGLSVVVSVRVGQSLGRNNPTDAKHAVRVSFAISLCLCTIGSIFFLSLKDVLPPLFSNDSRVIDSVSDVLWLMVPYQFLSGLSIVYSGILRGCGRQVIGAIVYLVCFYGLIVPLGLYLMLGTPLKVKGNWIGNSAGQIFSTLTFCLIVFCTNWKKEAAKVGERTGLKLSDEPGRRSYGTTPVEESGNTEEPRESPTKIALKRVAVVLVFSAILFGGIMAREYAPMPSSSWPHDFPSSNNATNSTDVNNSPSF
ncbi:multidrug and toxin extrusion protein 1-like [Tubulanus polymorphus]|uniref:multidrug and toxin extrusion protein 1-like n=1 Tax=Tubulanus polymorphus TaxID=672921 RepID=UPI003DA62012